MTDSTKQILLPSFLRPNFKTDLGEDLSNWGEDTLDSAIKIATELDG